jgi:hypothetical protein
MTFTIEMHHLVIVGLVLLFLLGKWLFTDKEVPLSPLEHKNLKQDYVLLLGAMMHVCKSQFRTAFDEEICKSKSFASHLALQHLKAAGLAKQVDNSTFQLLWVRLGELKEEAGLATPEDAE